MDEAWIAIEQEDTVCELWDVEHFEPLPHSRLYHLEPIGVGSAMVESFTSYITRLAKEHHIYPRVLFLQEILPLWNIPYLFHNGHAVYENLSSFWRDSAKLNGTNTWAGDLVQAMEKLTLRQNLAFLTMLPFSKILSDQSLIRQRQAWCPKCYGEWQESKKAFYNPLLWSLKIVSMCLRHRCYLQTQCSNPSCTRQLTALTPRGQVGFCSWCGHWLGQPMLEKADDLNKVDEKEWAWQQFVGKTLEELFTAVPLHDETIPLNSLSDWLTTNLNELTKGNKSALARRLCVDTSVIYKWLNQKGVPRLESLIRISAYLGTPLLRLLMGASLAPAIHPSQIAIEHIPRNQLKRQPRKVNRGSLQSALEAVLQGPEDPPPSLREVARRLDLDVAILWNYFPELCKEISANYLDYRTNQGKKRYQIMYDQMKEAIQSLLSQGIYPSHDHIEKLLERTLFIEPEFIEARRKILEELRQGE